MQLGFEHAVKPTLKRDWNRKLIEPVVGNLPTTYPSNWFEIIIISWISNNQSCFLKVSIQHMCRWNNFFQIFAASSYVSFKNLVIRNNFFFFWYISSLNSYIHSRHQYKKHNPPLPRQFFLASWFYLKIVNERLLESVNCKSNFLLGIIRHFYCTLLINVQLMGLWVSHNLNGCRAARAFFGAISWNIFFNFELPAHIAIKSA